MNGTFFLPVAPALAWKSVIDASLSAAVGIRPIGRSSFHPYLPDVLVSVPSSGITTVPSARAQTSSLRRVRTLGRWKTSIGAGKSCPGALAVGLPDPSRELAGHPAGPLAFRMACEQV